MPYISLDKRRNLRRIPPPPIAVIRKIIIRLHYSSLTFIGYIFASIGLIVFLRLIFASIMVNLRKRFVYWLRRRGPLSKELQNYAIFLFLLRDTRKEFLF